MSRPMSVCGSVNLSVCPRGYLWNHMRDLYQIFLCMLPVSVARSSCDIFMIGRIAYRREGVFFPIDNAYISGTTRAIFYRQHCAQRKPPVFNLLRADFEVFRPAAATRCTDARACPTTVVSCATRRPCCHREPLHDAGHFYRKLVPNPLATQWIERTLKLSANREVVEKKILYKQVSHCRTDTCRRMVSRDPRAKVHEIRVISFDWPNPNVAKFRRAPTKGVRDIRCGKNLYPGKVGQSSP